MWSPFDDWRPWFRQMKCAMKASLPHRGSQCLVLLAGLLAAASGEVRRSLADDGPKPATEPWVAPARAARKPNPVAADTNSLAQGKQLFIAGCLPCHGPAGKGDGPAAPSLERKPGNLSDPKMWEQSDGTIFWKISEGKAPMPAFQEAFTEEQRWHVVNFVRTLAPRLEQNNSEPKNGGK